MCSVSVLLCWCVVLFMMLCLLPGVLLIAGAFAVLLFLFGLCLVVHVCCLRLCCFAAGDLNRAVLCVMNVCCLCVVAALCVFCLFVCVFCFL